MDKQNYVLKFGLLFGVSIVGAKTSLAFFSLLLLLFSVSMLFILTTEKIFVGIVALMLFLSLILYNGEESMLLTMVWTIIPGVMAGFFWKKMSSAYNILLATFGTFAGTIFLYIFSIEFLQPFYFENKLRTLMSLQYSYTQDALDATVLLTKTFTPSIVLIFSFIMGVVYVKIMHYALTKCKVSAPHLMPLREWRFPKSTVWYYLIFTVSKIFFLSQKEINATDAFFIQNLSLIGEFVFILQGFGFCAHFLHINKSRKKSIIAGVISFYLFISVIGALTVGAQSNEFFTTLIVFLNLGLAMSFLLLNALGILDVLFPIRKYFSKPK